MRNETDDWLFLAVVTMVAFAFGCACVDMLPDLFNQLRGLR
mgnify:CR=1 FL=1